MTENVKIQVAVDFVNTDSLKEVTDSVKKALESVGGESGGLEISVDQGTLNGFQALVRQFKEILLAFRGVSTPAASNGEVTVEQNEGTRSDANLAALIQQELSQLNDSIRQLNTSVKALDTTTKTRRSNRGSGNTQASGGVADENISQFNSLSGELDKTVKLSERIKSIQQAIGKVLGNNKGQIADFARILDKDVSEGFSVFQRTGLRNLEGQLRKSQQRVLELTTDFVRLKQEFDPNDPAGQGASAIIEAQISTLQKLVETQELEARTIRDKIDARDLAIKADQRYEKSIANVTRAIDALTSSEITTAQQLRSNTVQFQRIRQVLTNDIKTYTEYQQLLERLNTSLIAQRNENLANQKTLQEEIESRKALIKTAKENTDLSDEQVASIESQETSLRGLLKTLEELKEAERSFTNEIKANETAVDSSIRKIDDLNERSTQVVSILSDNRSRIRILEETDRLAENARKGFERLNVRTREYGDLIQRLNSQDLFKDADQNISLATSALNRFNTLIRQSEDVASGLSDTYKREVAEITKLLKRVQAGDITSSDILSVAKIRPNVGETEFNRVLKDTGDEDLAINAKEARIQEALISSLQLKIAGLTDEFKEQSGQIKVNQNRLREYFREASGGNIGRFVELFRATDGVLEKQESNLRRNTALLQQYSNEVANGGQAALFASKSIRSLGNEFQKNASDLNRLITELNLLESEVGTLDPSLRQLRRRYTELRDENISLAQGVEKNSKRLSIFENQIKRLAGGLKLYRAELAESIIEQFKFINALTIVSSAMFAARAAFTEYIEESRALARTFTVMRSASLSFAEIQTLVTQRVREASIAFGESISDTAEVVKQLGSAGFSTETSLAALESTLKLVVSTQADAESSTRTIAGIYRIWGDQIRGTGTDLQAFTKINDVLISVYRNHQVELEELNQGFKFAASASQAAGFTYEQTAAFLAVLNDNMIKSGTAGRGLQVIFAQLANKTQQFSDAFGIEIDPNSPLSEQFVGILQGVNQQLANGALSTKELSKQFRILGLRGARSFITLARQFDSVQGTLKELEQDAAGTADELSTIVRDSLAKEFESARQSLLDIGRAFIEPLKDVLVFVSNITQGISDLVNSSSIGPIIASFTIFGGILLAVSQTAIAVGQVFFTLGGQLLGATTIASAFASELKDIDISALSATRALAIFQKAVDSAGASALKTGAQVGFLSKAFSFLGGPAGLIASVVIGFIALGGAFAATSNSSRELSRDIDRLSGEIAQFGRDRRNIATFVTDLEKIQREIDTTSRSAQVLGQEVVKAFETLGPRIVSQGNIVTRTNEEIVESFDEIRQAALNDIELNIRVNNEAENFLREQLLGNLQQDLQNSLTEGIESGFLDRVSGEILRDIDFTFRRLNNRISDAAQFEISNTFARGPAIQIETGFEDLDNFSQITSEIKRLETEAARARKTFADQNFFGQLLDGESYTNLVDVNGQLEILRLRSEGATRANKAFTDSLEAYNRIKSLTGDADLAFKSVEDRLNNLATQGTLTAKTVELILDRIRVQQTRGTRSGLRIIARDQQDAITDVFATLDNVRDILDVPFSQDVFDQSIKDLQEINQLFVQLDRQQEDSRKALLSRDSFGVSEDVENLTKNLVKIGAELSPDQKRGLDSFVTNLTNQTLALVRQKPPIEIGAGELLALSPETIFNTIAPVIRSVPAQDVKKIKEEFNKKFDLSLDTENIKFSNEEINSILKNVVGVFDGGQVSVSEFGQGLQKLSDSFGLSVDESQDLLNNLFALEKVNLQSTNDAVSNLASNFKDARFSQTTFNSIRQLRLEARRLQQEFTTNNTINRLGLELNPSDFNAFLKAADKANKERIENIQELRRRIEDEQEAFAKAIAQGQEDPTNEENASRVAISKEALENSKAQVEALNRQLEATKSQVDLQAQRLEIFKQINDRLTEAGIEIQRQSRQIQITSQRYQDSNSELTEQSITLSKNLKTQIQILKETENITGSYSESAEALGEILATSNELLDVTNQRRDALTAEVEERFALLELAEQILDPLNEQAGLQQKVAGATATITNALADVKRFQGDIALGDLKSEQAIAERLNAYRRILEAINDINGAVEEQAKLEISLGKIQEGRLETIKSIQGVFSGEANQLEQDLRSAISTAFDQAPLEVARTIGNLIGQNAGTVLSKTSESVDLLVQGIQDGTIETTGLNSQIDRTIGLYRIQAEEAERFAQAQSRIAQIQFNQQLQLADIAINTGQYEQALTLVGQLNSKVSDIAQGDAQVAEGLFKQVLEIQNELAGRTTDRILNLDNSIGNAEGFLDVMRATKDLTFNIKQDLETGTNLALTNFRQIAEILDNRQTIEEVGFFVNDARRESFDAVTQEAIESFNKAQEQLDEFVQKFPEFSKTQLQAFSDTSTGLNQLKIAADDVKDAFKSLRGSIPNTSEPRRQGFQNGGVIDGFGGGDQIPALLERGEAVIPKSVVARLGPRFFRNIIAGKMPKFQNGGIIGIDSGTASLGLELPTRIFEDITKGLQKSFKDLRGLFEEARKNPVFDPDRGGFQAGVGILNSTVKDFSTAVSALIDALPGGNSEEINRQLEQNFRLLGSIISNANQEESLAKFFEALTKDFGVLRERGVAAQAAEDISTETQGLDQGITSISSQQKRVEQSLLSNLKLQTELLQQRNELIRATNDIIKSSRIGSFLFDNVSNFFSTFRTETVSFLTNFFEPAFAEQNAATFQQFIDQLRSIESTFNQTFDSARSQIQRNQTDYLSYLNTIEQAELQRIQQRADAERQYREQLIETEKVFKDSFENGLSTILEERAKAFETNLEGFSTRFFGEIEDNLSLFVGNFSLLRSNNREERQGRRNDSGILSEVSRATSDIVKDLRTNFVEAFGEVGEPFRETVGAAARLFAGSFTNLIGTIGPILIQSIGSLLQFAISDENAARVATFIDKFARELPERADDFTNRLIENVSIIVEAFVRALPVALETLISQLPQLGENLINIISENLPRVVDSVADALPALIQALVPLLSQLTQVVLDNIPTIIGALAESIPVIIAEVIRQVLSGQLIVSVLRGVFGGLIELLRGILRGIRRIAGENPDTFHTGGLIPGNKEDVLIIAQSGEGVLSRRGMQALGGKAALDQLNAGRSLGTFHTGGVVGEPRMMTSTVSTLPVSSGPSTVSNSSTNNISVQANFNGATSDRDVRRQAKILVDAMDEELAKKISDRDSDLALSLIGVRRR